MQIQLVELEPNREFKSTVELDQDVIIFGRGRPGEGFIQLPQCGGSWLSKSHCTIWRDGQKWFLCDGELGGHSSKNGVLLDGELITGPVQLRLGQIFTLLVPPPCEIQLRVVEGQEDLEDTLTPAIEQFARGPESAAAVDELREAIAALHQQLAENRKRDETLQGEVASAAAARAKQEKALETSMADFQAMSQQGKERLESMERRQTLLTRMMSGLALGVAIGLLTLAPPVETEQRGFPLEIALEILLAVAGGGGLAVSSRSRIFHGDDDENRFFPPDAPGGPDSATGELAPGRDPEGGRGALFDCQGALRAA